MISGYIIDSETRKIAIKVSNLLKYNNTTLIGIDSKAVVGTGIIVITDAEFDVGDILPIDVPDRSAEVPLLAE